MKDELSLLQYWRIIWKYKIFIACLFVFFVTASLFRSSRQPVTYKATASILPSAGMGDDTSSYRMMMYYGMMSHSDIFIALLKSRTIYEEVLKQTGDKIISVPEPLVEVTNENIINVSVIDTNPQRAAQLANIYVSSLDNLYLRLNIEEAGQKRRFIKVRMLEAEGALKEAENRIEEFSRKHNIAGARHSFDTPRGGLENQLLAKRIELESMMLFATSYNPEVIRLRREIEKIEEILAGAPSIEKEMARLIRDLKVQETLYQHLVTQYEQAKMEEMRDLPSVQVLDWAVPATSKHGPRTKRNAAASGLIALFLGVFMAFFVDYVNTERKYLDSAKD